MIIFTNYNKVKENKTSKEYMKFLTDELKKNDLKIKVIDSEMILSFDNFNYSENQLKIKHSNDLILRSILKLDLFLSKFYEHLKNNNDDIIISTVSWTELLELVSSNINQIDNIEDKIIEVLNIIKQKIHEYFTLVADSILKDLIKKEIELKTFTIEFDDSNKKSFTEDYFNITKKYYSIIKTSLTAYLYRNSGYAGHYLFKNNLSYLHLEERETIVKQFNKIIKSIKQHNENKALINIECIDESEDENEDKNED